MPIIIGTNGILHEKSAEHLRSLGVNLAKFMAFAVFSVEYQHHKATLAYMMRMNAAVTERAAAATDGYGPVC